MASLIVVLTAAWETTNKRQSMVNGNASSSGLCVIVVLVWWWSCYNIKLVVILMAGVWWHQEPHYCTCTVKELTVQCSSRDCKTHTPASAIRCSHHYPSPSMRSHSPHHRSYFEDEIESTILVAKLRAAPVNWCLLSHFGFEHSLCGAGAVTIGNYTRWW